MNPGSAPERIGWGYPADQVPVFTRESTGTSWVCVSRDTPPGGVAKIEAFCGTTGPALSIDIAKVAKLFQSLFVLLDS